MKINTFKLKLAALALGLELAAVGGLRADTFGSGTNQFTIDFVTVGDPGNPDDTGSTGSYFSPYGGVNYTFRIGVCEISREMMLHANAAGGLGLTLLDMSPYGGNVGTHPATGITWNEAARFVNWLNISQGSPPAYKFALQPGDAGYDPNANLELWTAGDAGFDPADLYRNRNAHYFLPGEDEWYKAAYYSGTGAIYYDYATQQDAPDTPTPVAGGTTNGTAVYGQNPSSIGPSSVAQAGGLSHYGTVGQNGNVFEWLESAGDGTNDSPSELRAARGGCWDDRDDYDLRSAARSRNSPTLWSYACGFRVAADVASTEVPPRLHLQVLGGNLVVSWPSASAGWTPQQCDDLTSGSWSAIAGSITDDGTSKSVLISPPAGNLFFRLVK